MDELMRHQPTLKTDAMMAIIKVHVHVMLLQKHKVVLCDREIQDDSLSVPDFS